MDFAVQPISFNDLNSTSASADRAASAVRHHKTATDTAAVQATQQTHDTIKLSVTSQIEALKQKGASTVEIATKLGLSISDVDKALHVTPLAAATQTSASASATLIAPR